MPAPDLPQLHRANAHFVTPQLAVGGDLDPSLLVALRQLDELVAAGVTHIVDVRIEASDADLVARRWPHVRYLHHGIDDMGQRVPAEWFEETAGFALDAIAGGGVVLTHCHMGVNRGPSLGYAVLLGLGWDPVEALAAIRTARPIAYVDYAEDALTWHHGRTGNRRAALRRDIARLRRWRAGSDDAVGEVLRLTRRRVSPTLAGLRRHPRAVVLLVSLRSRLESVLDVDIQPFDDDAEQREHLTQLMEWVREAAADDDALAWTVVSFSDTASLAVDDVAVAGHDLDPAAVAAWRAAIVADPRLAVGED
ncbi:MAG: dual specificity protein phosphatase family protein [Actinomycetota bacterium]